MSFNTSEIPGLAPFESTQVVLDSFGFQAPKRSTARAPAINPAGTVSNGFGPATSTSNQVNVLQPRKGKPKPAQRRRIDLGGGAGGFRPPVENDVFATPLQPLLSPSRAQASTAQMFENARNAFGLSNGNSDAADAGPSRGHKRKSELLEGGIPARKVLGASNTAFEAVQEIRPPRTVSTNGTSLTGSGKVLALPAVQSVLRAKSTAAQGETYITAHNARSDSERNKVVLSRGGYDIWADFVPSSLVGLCASEKVSGVSCEDGTLVGYMSSGRR